MPDIILKYNTEEWNDLVEANDPMVACLKALIDETQKRVNDDFTIKLQVGGKKVKTLSPRERAKRAEEEAAAAEARRQTELKEKQELKEDLERIAKIWSKSSSIAEVNEDLRALNATGPISKKRASVIALNKDKKFLKDFGLKPLPEKLAAFSSNAKALEPKVLAELKQVFNEMIAEEVEETHWDFGDFEGQSILKNIMKNIAGDSAVDEEKYLPMAQKIIMDFFEAKMKELKDDDYCLMVMPGKPPSNVIFTSDFYKKYVHEL